LPLGSVANFVEFRHSLTSRLIGRRNRAALRRSCASDGASEKAALVMEAVLVSALKSEPMALVLAEAVLARALGGPHLTPLFAMGLHRNDLRKRGADLHAACHRAVRVACIEAVRLANDLT